MQKPVEPKKILCIHDLSGVGRCSLAVILPVLSVMGFQPVALPTVVLSTHTGGLGPPARLDGSAYGMAALEHYQELGLQFDCIYTGYLGGEAQVALAEKAFALWPAAYKVVDPVMGDNGKAYSTVTPALVERIRSLCRAADLILPNYTEAQLLLQQQPVTEQLDDASRWHPTRWSPDCRWASTSAVPVPAQTASSSKSCTSAAVSPARGICTALCSSVRCCRATP